MTEKEIKNRLMDYLYGEMSAAEKNQFERDLKDHPEMQAELRELQDTRKLLGSKPIDVPPKKLLMLNLPDHTKTSYPRITKSVLAVAATLLITVFALSFVNMQVDQTEAGFHVSFGEPPASQPDQPEQQITEEEIYELISDMQQENARVFSDILDQTRQEHQQQMEEVIRTLTEYYDQRRRQDLLLISEGLAHLEEETYYRFLQTEETLEDLIFALSYQQNEDTSNE